MKTDYNSVKNQDIKSKFVGIHVYSNVNDMVEYILSQDDYSNSPFTYDDVSNFYSYPEYYGEFASFEGGSDDEKQSEINRLEDLATEANDNEEYEKFDVLTDEINELENLESEPQEVYEWWIVSSFLMEKLRDMGEVVIESHNIWGRCTTDQAILLDHAISKICEGMEILEGQPNEWNA